MLSPESAHPRRIVLVDYPHADTEGKKQRPAVVVSTLDYFQQTKRITVLMITSKEQKAKCETDRVILRWQEAGLVKPSAVRCRPNSLLTDRTYPIGQLQPSDFNEAMAALRQALGI
ncbi:MAG: type II toxin-antitoxin system PemK/MazF family toxin [Fimbriimonadales bacterium]